jgi:hypothetical protein
MEAARRSARVLIETITLYIHIGDYITSYHCSTIQPDNYLAETAAGPVKCVFYMHPIQLYVPSTDIGYSKYKREYLVFNSIHSR